MSPLDAFLDYIGSLSWDDLVAGYDFGLLSSLEIQSQAVGWLVNWPTTKIVDAVEPLARPAALKLPEDFDRMGAEYETFKEYLLQAHA